MSIRITQSIFFLIAAFMFMELAGSSAQAGMTGYEIAEKAYYVEDGDDVKSLINMVIVKSNGKKKERKLAMARKDYGRDNRSLIRFTGPADVKGTSFLTWNFADKTDNDQWLYLPALKRVKRISTSNKSKSFMGSDFSYEDMSKRSLSKDTFRLIQENTYNGAACYVVESISKDPAEAFVKRVAWIRKDNFLVVRTDFYDADGVLSKQFAAGTIKPVQNIDTVLFVKMTDIKNGGFSTMQLKKIRYNNGMEDRLFSVEGIKK